MSKGLGDTIEKITTKTGIKKVVEKVFGENCGCEKRKEKLNKIFKYRKIECLNESEYIYLKEFFKINRNRLTTIEQAELLKIYNRVFNSNRQPSSCSSCVRELINEINKLYTTYNEE